MRRANDPQRREKIIQATLEAVKLYGIHAVTHRKIATLAGVPLGSMTYYFSGIDELLLEAFSRFTEIMSRQYQAPEINALATLILGAVGIVGFIAWYLMARAEKQRIRDIQRARRG